MKSLKKEIEKITEKNIYWSHNSTDVKSKMDKQLLTLFTKVIDDVIEDKLTIIAKKQSDWEKGYVKGWNEALEEAAKRKKKFIER